MENLTPPAAGQNGRFAGCCGVDHPAGGSNAGGGRWAALACLSSSVAALAAGAGAVRSGKAGRLWALCRWRRWRWCVVIWCGGLLLAWSSGAALAALILPGAGGGRNVRVLRPALPGYFPAFPRGGAMPSACRAADPADRAGRRREGEGKRKRPERRRMVRCCSGLLSALAVLHPVRFCRLPEGSDSPLYRVVL